MPLDFPSNPSLNQTYTLNGRTWKWNGTGWQLESPLLATSGIEDAAVTTAKIADSAVTSAKIADGTIVNADVSASAAIAYSKLASLTSANILVGNASNVATATAVTGDVTISNTGVTAIGSGVIVDADVSASAEIAVSKLADGAARQLLQTDAAGTGVEWTSNVDIPGTLDVTSAATFDSTISFPLGSAGSPSIYPGTDTNTGFWSPGADTVAVSAGGRERLRVRNFGDINEASYPGSDIGFGVAAVLKGDAYIAPSYTARWSVLSHETQSGAIANLLSTWSDTTWGGGANYDVYYGDTWGSSGRASAGHYFKTSANADGTGEVMGFRITGQNQRTFTAFGPGYTERPAFFCRAWVNFNGTGTVAIRGSGNVSSITDNGTGTYEVNFSTALPDTNYACFVQAHSASTAAQQFPVTWNDTTYNTISKAGVATRVVDNDGNTMVIADYDQITVSVFR